MNLDAVGAGFVTAALASLAVSPAGARTRVGLRNQGDAGWFTPAGDVDVVSARLDAIVPATLSQFGSNYEGHIARWRVGITRVCWPTLNSVGSHPTHNMVDDASAALLQDALALHGGLRIAQQAGWLLPAGCGVTVDEVRFGTLSRIPPRGGVAGWELALEHIVDGFGSGCPVNPYA